MNAVGRVKEVYQMLEDEESKETYLARLCSLVAGNREPLCRIVRKYNPELEERRDNRVFNVLAGMPEQSEIIIYGAGADSAEMVHCFKQDHRFAGFCDKNEEKQKTGFFGCKVISPEDLLAKKNVSVGICTRRYYEEVTRFLIENGVKEEQIYDFRKCVAVKDPGTYFAGEFISFEENEIFVDAGCFNFNSSITMEKYCPNVRKIYAFEPDPQNYQVCVQKQEVLKTKQIELLPYATWNEKTSLYFDAEETASSKVNEAGQTKVEAVSIDSVMDEKEKITFIKMDVEGAELESLKGAEKTIRRCKPKLAVCIYHKPEDMIELPLYIKSLVPEYKFYIRHHSTSMHETVLYAVL